MYQFKSLTALTQFATIALAAFLVTDLLSPILMFYALGQVRAGADPAGFAFLDIVNWANLAVLVASFILVGMWIYRASANAHSFSGEMTITPGWAVGWYFVPFANLVKPYQAMREVWMASHFRGNWHSEPTPSQLVAWWALWIITNILNNISFRMDRADLIDAKTNVDLFEGALNAMLCIILIMILRAVARAQSRATYDETFA